MSPALIALAAMWSAQAPSADDVVEAVPQVYSFSSKSGRLAALVYEGTSTENSGRSHHHVVVAGTWSGRLRWDLDGGCAGEFVVPVDGLTADAPEERVREGFAKPLTDRDRVAVNEHLRERDQLFADRFPNVRYEVTACETEESGHVVIRGEFKLRGITQPVAFRVTATEADGMLTLEGQGSITHTDFGFEPYYALFGQRQNQDRMQLVIDVEGKALGGDAGLAAPLTEGPRSR